VIDVQWNDDGTVRVGDVRLGSPETFIGPPADEPAEGLLLLYKPRDMIDAYAPIIDEFHGGRMVELGIFRGGSTAFFAVAMSPAQLVALELSSSRLPLLDDFVESRGLSDAIRLHYGTDQSDQEAVSAIVDRELAGEPLDLVIDDASHLYGPTRASFEVLFPRVRPGGLYLIEDWFPPTPMLDHYAALATRTGSEELTAAEASLADHLRDPEAEGSRYFVDWLVGAFHDPASPHHEAVRTWYQALLATDQPTGRALRDRLQSKVEAGLVGLGHHPVLATMGTELVVALANRDVSGIADVRITPHWIEVRRSDRTLVPGEYHYDEIAYDHFGVMGGRRPDR
jgi:predicted O-methyltransferase YrrM